MNEYNNYYRIFTHNNYYSATAQFGSKFQRYAYNNYNCVPSLFERTRNEAN